VDFSRDFSLRFGMCLRYDERDEQKQMRSALFWDITRRRVVIVYRRFGTKYRSHLQGPSPWTLSVILTNVNSIRTGLGSNPGHRG
jgi:hypothetical protein